MGLLDKILGKQKEDVARPAPAFASVTEYMPVFTSYSGSIYEQSLTRAAIDRIATGCSKLKPEIMGNARPRITRAVRTSPNDYMTWSSFLYRLATILECDTTAFVVPSLSADGETMTGLFPLKCEFAEIVLYGDEPWVRFHFATGKVAAIELKNVVILTRYQYQSDFFGEKHCLTSTLNLLHIQEEAQETSIKNGATIRFLGSLSGQVREEDIKKKRERFAAENLSALNTSQLILYDNTFTDLKQIEPYSYTIPNDEMERIKNNVYDYFGINEDVMQNHYNEEHWNAFYEGKIEPFAIQLGDGLTKMLFTQQEQLKNSVSFSSNRLEYMSSPSKRNMIRDMLDRGVFCIDDARAILQMPPLPNGEGQVRVIRGEYVDASMMDSPTDDQDPNARDQTKKDSDEHGASDDDKLDS